MAQGSADAAGFLVGHLARLASARLSQRLAPFDLTPAQWQVLVSLAGQDGQTQKDLTEQIGVEQATMANTLSRMEKSGLIVRRPHPDDRRAQTVHITGNAALLTRPSRDAVEAAGLELLAGLPEAERALFLSMVTRMIVHLQSLEEGNPVSFMPENG